MRRRTKSHQGPRTAVATPCPTQVRNAWRAAQPHRQARHRESACRVKLRWRTPSEDQLESERRMPSEPGCRLKPLTGLRGSRAKAPPQIHTAQKKTTRTKMSSTNTRASTNAQQQMQTTSAHSRAAASRQDSPSGKPSVRTAPRSLQAHDARRRCNARRRPQQREHQATSQANVSSHQRLTHIARPEASRHARPRLITDPPSPPPRKCTDR